MKAIARRLVLLVVAMCPAVYVQIAMSAQSKVETCCICGAAQFDEDCQGVCPPAPDCECGYASCSGDGAQWQCPEWPVCDEMYQPVCQGGQWACEYVGGGGGGGGGCESYCNCPYWDPLCEYCDGNNCDPCEYDPFSPECWPWES